jgi:hypothetical protein
MQDLEAGVLNFVILAWDRQNQSNAAIALRAPGGS